MTERTIRRFSDLDTSASEAVLTKEVETLFRDEAVLARLRNRRCPDHDVPMVRTSDVVLRGPMNEPSLWVCPEVGCRMLIAVRPTEMG